MPGPHLLLFGWYRPGTGFTRVLQALLPHLARHWRITWMGVGYRGDERELMPGVRLRPTNLHGGDLVGAVAARRQWSTLGADAVLALNDPWYLEHYSRELAVLLDAVPMYGYLPLDGDIPDPQLVAGLIGFRRLFTYTKHAARQLRGALQGCGNATPVSLAGHGVDQDAFAPAAGVRDADLDPRARMQLAQQLFGLPEPAWVVLNAARPDPRKRIDLSIEGFARFARGLPGNVKLCLHQAIAHAPFVEPLRQQARDLGVDDRLLWWPPCDGPLDDDALCALYNACAVGLNSSLGEGFGLVSFEHAATGAPQLVPGQAALRELWRDAAILLPAQPVRVPHSPLVMGEVAPEAIADGLHRLHADEAGYRRYARAGLNRCAAPDLRWQHCAMQLLDGMTSAIS